MSQRRRTDLEAATSNMETLARNLRLNELDWIGVLDILVVAVVVYQILVNVRGTRVVQMLLGLGFVASFLYVASWAGLGVASFLLANILPYLVFAIIVIFQAEIRAALARFGRHTLPFRALFAVDRSELVDVVSEAVSSLTAKGTGALIVIERDIGLGSYVESGILIDARLSYDLLVTLFNRDVPLHDGAVIIRRDRIVAAACVLPLTTRAQVSRNLGTRHRAAIGITEETDAVVIVVSEGTGIISFAANGEIIRQLNPEGVKVRLREALEVGARKEKGSPAGSSLSGRSEGL